MTREADRTSTEMHLRSDFSAAGDAQLAVAVGRGRRDALAEVYERHSGAVFDVARRVGGERCATAVVQQAFLDLWQAPEDFDPSDTLRAHLVRQARLAALDQSAEPPARTTVHPDRERLPIDDHGRPPSAAAEHAWPLLARLPTDERGPIWMTYFMGYSPRDVAARLQQPERLVHQRITSGLRRLRSLHDTTAGADPAS